MIGVWKKRDFSRTQSELVASSVCSVLLAVEPVLYLSRSEWKGQTHSHPSLRRDVIYNSRQFQSGAGSAFLASMRECKFFVYIMASKSRVLYTGITNDLAVRVFQHKTARFAGFTKQYRVHRLVYFESFRYVRSAIVREKEIKHWTRQRRVELIESMNATWEDLAVTWFSEELLTDPNAPAVMKHDPAKIQSTGEDNGTSKFREPALAQPVRIKFRPSKVRTFGSDKDHR